jgi:hypothetical protein
MAYILGESVNIGLGVESTRGTAVSPQAWIAGRTPTGVRPVVDKVLVAETKGSRITSQGSEIVQKRVEGNLEFNLKNETIGWILKALMGTVNSATKGGETTVYTHEFSIALNNPQNPSLTLALSQPNFQDYKYNLVVPSSLEIETPIDDLATATVEFVGAEEETATDYSPAFSGDDYYFRNHDVTIKIATDVAGLAGASEMKTKEFSLSVVNNARTNQNLGELNPSDVLALMFEITGSMTLDYTNETYHDIYTAGNYRAMEISLVRSDITIGNASNPTITITLPKVSFEDLSPDRPIDDIVTSAIDFTAHYDNDEASAITVDIVNELSDYNAVSVS